MPDGRGGEAKPSIFQRSSMKSLVCLVMSLIAWWIVSGWFAHSWTSRSPSSHASLGESLGKMGIRLSLFGWLFDRPKRSSNSDDPADSVTVSPSAGTTGPRTSLSDGGWWTPKLAGVPPAVRNRARVVIVWSSPGSPSAVTSKAATQVNACFAAGPGVRTPDWWAPWNGYDARWAASLRVAASARPPPARTLPASAVPAAPVAVPLMNLRRLRSTGFVS